MLITLRPATLVRLVIGAASAGAIVAMLSLGGSSDEPGTPPEVNTTAEVHLPTNLLW